MILLTNTDKQRPIYYSQEDALVYNNLCLFHNPVVEAEKDRNGSVPQGR